METRRRLEHRLDEAPRAAGAGNVAEVQRNERRAQHGDIGTADVLPSYKADKIALVAV